MNYIRRGQAYEVVVSKDAFHSVSWRHWYTSLLYSWKCLRYWLIGEYIFENFGICIYGRTAPNIQIDQTFKLSVCNAQTISQSVSSNAEYPGEADVFIPLTSNASSSLCFVLFRHVLGIDVVDRPVPPKLFLCPDKLIFARQSAICRFNSLADGWSTYWESWRVDHPLMNVMNLLNLPPKIQLFILLKDDGFDNPNPFVTLGQLSKVTVFGAENHCLIFSSSCPLVLALLMPCLNSVHLSFCMQPIDPWYWIDWSLRPSRVWGFRREGAGSMRHSHGAGLARRPYVHTETSA